MLVDKYGLNKTDVDVVRGKIQKNQVYVFLLSGKMGSGKDSLAQGAAEKLNVPFKHLYFADNVKEELNSILADLRNNTINWEARNIPVEKGQHLTTILASVLEDETVHSRTRIAQIRAANQYLGTEIRREQDPDYWVKPVLFQIVELVKNNTSVYLTDGRFPNEAEALTYLGGKVIRIEISEDVQKTRLMGRDGVLPSVEALQHPSETALDDYNGFFAKVDNNSSFEKAVLGICAKLKNSKKIDKSAGLSR